MTNRIGVHARRASACAALACGVLALTGCGGGQLASFPPDDPDRWATPEDRAAAEVFAARDADWRYGPVIYQVFVDRFAPASQERLADKLDAYAEPRTLMPWDQTPEGGRPTDGYRVWTHELEFWGGDLVTLRDKLDYIDDLGADAVYLNPVFEAMTNHMYDTHDYYAVDPAYGNDQDLDDLIADVHRRDMRIMLDGVFNHKGSFAPIVEDAIADADSPYRDWFYIGDEHELGYRAWLNVPNLPELNLDGKPVRAYLYGGPDSVVRHYVRRGIDGWRLDTAYELGPTILRELTDAAQQVDPEAAVVGEVWSYPDFWLPSMDGVMNLHLRDVLLRFARGDMPAAQANQSIARMVEDCGVEPLLRSWLVLDNHDTSRLAHDLPDPDRRKLALALQLTLPGAPVVYYGTELGMQGAGDPANRAPMRWDLVTDDNPTLALFKRLIDMRSQQRALRVGDYRQIDARSLVAFLRYTDRVEETVLVVVNNTDEPVREALTLRFGKLASYGPWRDILENAPGPGQGAGVIDLEMAPRSVRVLQPVVDRTGYSPYGRVH